MLPDLTKLTPPRSPRFILWRITVYSHWHSIIESSNEETFHERVLEFEQKYLPDYSEEVRYVKTNWLDQYKEKLVKAWVDRHLHFDNVVTSRVEGIHWLLKSQLKVSTLDLFEAWRSIKHVLLNQLAELKSNQDKQHTRTPIELSGVLYGAVRGWVSHEALRKVEQQRKLLFSRDPLPSPTCTGSFTQSQGLPCVHKLECLLAQDQTLQLEDFHHWHLHRKDSPQPLLEPRRRIDPVIASSSLPLSSVRRELSGFEVIENVRATRTPPLCSKCHILGHTRTSKDCPLRYSELRALPTVFSKPPKVQLQHLRWIPDPVSEQPLLSSTTAFEQIQWQSVITPEEFEFDAASEHSLQLAIESEPAV